MQFFLNPDNTTYWAQVQDLVARGDDQKLRQYVVEAHRLTSAQRTVRIATEPTVIDGEFITPGTVIILMLVSGDKITPQLRQTSLTHGNRVKQDATVSRSTMLATSNLLAGKSQ